MDFVLSDEKLLNLIRNEIIKLISMNFKFTKRDFKFFMIGIFAMFVFVIIYEWDDFEKGFKNGYYNTSQIEKTE